MAKAVTGKTKKIINTPSIKSCTCKHEFQDEKYGNGKRVHNGCGNGFRCTVCKTVR